MASNSFGNIFKFTTWGETHGPAIGVVVDGVPAGISLTVEEINAALSLRAPGRSPFTSPRAEADTAEILSGVFEGQTTGAPVSILIHNQDKRGTAYEPMKNLLRPGHANYTYIEKYGCFDYFGGGRSSARETAGRVAVSVIAKKILATADITCVAYIKNIGGIAAQTPQGAIADIYTTTYASPIYCPDADNAAKMMETLTASKDAGDSLGGIVEFITSRLPIGLGDPIYEKLEANLAKAMMSLPASKGFEIGEGFQAANMSGSTHNDGYRDGQLSSNHAGGTLGGISNGEPLIGRVVFKPTSSINKPQQTSDLEGKNQILELPAGSRHDPCVAIRAVPVVEAMLALVLADAMLMNRTVKVLP